MSKLTAVYVRVSTTDQVGGMESQIRALTEWCTVNAVTNFEFFTDEGFSGAKESRPALNRLMLAVDEDRVEQVIVFSFSRFARSTTHLLKALNRFKEKKVRFLSITESLDTNSPMGVALLTILGALSQLERELIVERVRAGLRNARAKGKIIGRVRKRNSALIDGLLDAGLSFREIARIAKCSHGSVSAQKKEWLAKKAARELQLKDNPDAAIPSTDSSALPSPIEAENELKSTTNESTISTFGCQALFPNVAHQRPN
jgi:DNA invertase Pin-like site-specific DNA recombinase